MDSSEDRKLRPLLSSFQLRHANFANELAKQTRFSARLKKDISVEITEIDTPPEESRSVADSKKRSRKTKTPPKQFRGAANITITVEFSDDEGKKITGVVATAKYLARFTFNKEASPKDIKKALDQEPYQYLFVAQAYPLAVNHFRKQLQAMGLSTAGMPLGVV